MWALRASFVALLVWKAFKDWWVSICQAALNAWDAVCSYRCWRRLSVCTSVCQSVCLSRDSSRLHCAKMAEQISMLFWDPLLFPEANHLAGAKPNPTKTDIRKLQLFNVNSISKQEAKVIWQRLRRMYHTHCTRWLRCDYIFVYFIWPLVCICCLCYLSCIFLSILVGLGFAPVRWLASLGQYYYYDDDDDHHHQY